MTDFGAGQASCRCGAVWSGHRLAHCSGHGCHRTFGSVALFDRHLISGRGDEPSTHVDLTIKRTRSGDPIAVLAADGVVREPWRGRGTAVGDDRQGSQVPRDPSPQTQQLPTQNRDRVWEAA